LHLKPKFTAFSLFVILLFGSVSFAVQPQPAYAADVASVQWLEPSYSSSGTGVVRVFEPDLNIDPLQLDSFDVDVFSETDAGGIALTVTETNRGSGIFVGTVFFTTTDESSGHRLRVSPGDIITAEYEDFTLPDKFGRNSLVIAATTVVDTPVANDDSATTPEDSAVTIDVLNNDTDPNGDTLLLDSFDGVSANGGTITRDDNATPGDTSDDKLVYTPVSGFTGPDTFDYTVSDGSLTNTGTVTVTVLNSVDSVAAATGSGTITFSTSSGEFSGTITSITADDPSLPPGKPAGVTFPHGLSDLTITGLIPGETITITETYPAPLPHNTQIWKVDGTSWTPVPSTQITDNDSDAVIERTITDGGDGDADGVADGTIIDPAGPGEVPIPDTTFIKNWGSFGSATSEFKIPRGLGLGSVYVADTENDRIQKFDSAGNFQAEFGTRCTIFDGTGCNTNAPGAIVDGDGQFNRPFDVEVDPNSGNIVVADTNNNRIQVFDSSFNFLTKFGSSGSGPGQFAGAEGLAIDSAGNIYVADRLNDRIQKYDSTGTFLTSIGSSAVNNGDINIASDVALDSSENIYVTSRDNNHVAVFTSSGNFLFKFGSTCHLTSGFGCVDPDGAGPLELGDGQFRTPIGITVDSLDRIYVGEAIFSNRVQVFDSSGTFLTKFGSIGGVEGFGDGEFRAVEDIVVDDLGRIYTADRQNNRIQVFGALPPSVLSADITAANTITVVYDEAVSTVAGDYSDLILTAGGARAVTGISGSDTSTILLTFDGATAATDETATIDIASTVTSVATGGALFALNDQAVGNGQAPTMDSAITVDTSTIDVTFSEDLDDASIQLSDFTIDGVPVINPISENNGVVTITAATPFGPSDTPSVVLVSGSVDDVAGNTLDSAGPIAADDGIVPAAPVITTAGSTTNDNTPPLAGTSEADAIITVTSTIDGALATTTTASGLGAWLFADLNTLTDNTHSITVTATDAAGNESPDSNAISITVDTAAPTVQSAKFVSSITVVYSELVNTVDTDYSVVSLTSGGTRSVIGVDGSGTATIILTLDGAPLTTDETGTISIGATLTDNAGNPFNTATNPITITDGNPPVVSSAATTSTTSIELTMSETVTSTATAADFTIVGTLANGGPTISVGSVSASGSTVTLSSLGALLTDTDIIKVDYTKGTGSIDDAAPNSLASFTNQAVTNNLVVANNAPTVPAPIADVNVDEDAADTPIDLAAAFDDIEDADAALTYSVETNTNTGLVTTSITGTILTLDYVADQSGTADITVRATDTGTPGLFAEDTFIVTVDPINDLPVAGNDADTTPEETSILIDVLANDIDVDLDTLSVTGFDTATFATQGSPVNEAGQVRFTPVVDFVGVTSFGYILFDGTGTASLDGIVTVTVTPINDLPVAVNDAAATPQDQPITIDVLANDSDVESPTVTGIPLTIQSFDTLSLNGGAVAPNGNDLTYTPPVIDPPFTGPDTFTYTASDGTGGTSNIATVTVSVNVLEISLDRADYIVNHAGVIEVIDPGSNKNGNEQRITAHIKSTTDGVGFDVDLDETTGTSGIFRNINHVVFSSETSVPGTLHLQVAGGDTVTAEYSTATSATASIILPSALLPTEGTALDTALVGVCQDGDSDGDAICTEWEFDGLLFIEVEDTTATPPTSGFFEYASCGTPGDPDPICPNKSTKDVYVEIDWMEGHRPDPDALLQVIAAFAQPKQGQGGINLHITEGESVGIHKDVITLTSDQPGGSEFDQIKASFFGTAAERAAGTETLNAKRQVFHYVLFGHHFAENIGSSGYSEVIGNDIFISLGSFAGGVGTTDQQAGTLMHELGHNLGLLHGGPDIRDDNVELPFRLDNCKPNYLSVMSYSRQFEESLPGRALDFSQQALDPLDELRLDENLGVSPQYVLAGEQTTYGPASGVGGILTTSTGVNIDWNRQNGDTEADVSANINDFGIKECGLTLAYAAELPLKVLKGYEDWSNLVYDFRADSGVFADGVHTAPGAVREISFDVVVDLRVALVNTIIEAILSLPPDAFAGDSDQSRQDMKDEMIVVEDLIKQDLLEDALTQLQEVRAKTDGSDGGDPLDDLIVDPAAQTLILELIDVLIESLQIAQTPANLPPIANDDDITTPEGTPVIIPVLDNDADPEKNPLTIIDTTDPTNGQVTFDSQSVTYTPNPGFFGIDSFDYTISDSDSTVSTEGSGTDTAEVTVTVLESELETPQEQVQQLIDEIEELINSDIINAGQANSLISKLSITLDSLDENNVNASSGKLGAFINEIEAFIKSKKLTSEVGQPLIDIAQSIIDSLNN